MRLPENFSQYCQRFYFIEHSWMNNFVFETVILIYQEPKKILKKIQRSYLYAYYMFVVTQLTIERLFESNWYSSCSIYCVNNLSKSYKSYCIILCEQMPFAIVPVDGFLKKNCLLKMLDL